MNDLAPGPRAPETVTDLLEVLDNSADTLPRRLKQCAAFTRHNLHLIAASTVSEMAVASGVAPSVYVRFCQALGYSGYSEMQALFRAGVTEFRPDYQERLATLKQDGVVGTGRLLADFVEAGHKSIMSLANTVTNDSMDRIARGIAGARVVHLVGMKRAFAVVSSMAYLLDKLEVPANLHHGSGMLSSEGSIAEGDVLFVVTYAPFTQEVIQLAKTVSERGITVYGLTDSNRCPLAAYTSEMLVARENEVAEFRALTASIVLTAALAVAVRAIQEER